MHTLGGCESAPANTSRNNQEWNKKLDGALSNLICWKELLHIAAHGPDLVDF